MHNDRFGENDEEHSRLVYNILTGFEEKSSPKIESTDENAKTFLINALPYMKYNLERDEIVHILLF